MFLIILYYIHMEFSDLKIFVTVAEEGSATRAAELLAMTQPGVSQHLARLEDEIEEKLFDRIGKHLELNEFGRLFLGKARRILNDVEELKGMSTSEICPIGSLSLGMTASSALTVIPPAITKFRELYPGIQMNLDVHDSQEVEDDILRGHYDIGVVTAGIKTHPRLDEKILHYDRIDALVSKKHPLAKRRRISLEELAKWPLLIYPRRSRTRHIIDEAFHSKKIFPKEIINVYFNSASIKLAEAGIGVALLPKTMIGGEIRTHKFAHIRIQGDPIWRPICIARRRDAHLSEAIRRFYDILIAQK